MHPPLQLFKDVFALNWSSDLGVFLWCRNMGYRRKWNSSPTLKTKINRSRRSNPNGVPWMGTRDPHFAPLAISHLSGWGKRRTTIYRHRHENWCWMTQTNSVRRRVSSCQPRAASGTIESLYLEPRQGKWTHHCTIGKACRKKWVAYEREVMLEERKHEAPHKKFHSVQSGAWSVENNLI